MRRWPRWLMMMLTLLLVVVLASGCSLFSDQDPEGGDSDPVDDEETTLVLYFGGPEAEGLVREERTVILDADPAVLVVQELIQGPESDALLATIPEGTQLLNLSIADGTAEVDFSEEMITQHPGGSTGEILTIYSIVNSLTELPGIVQVQLLVQGETIGTLAGHIEISEPLERNSQIIQH